MLKDTNFWGSTYITYYAILHLRKSKGKIVVIASAAAKIAIPVATIYSVRFLLLNIYYEICSYLFPMFYCNIYKKGLAFLINYDI